MGEATISISEDVVQEAMLSGMSLGVLLNIYST